MLLIMCHCGENRYAIDSRHVREVLPRANLHRPGGSPPWLAGVLVHRGETTPIMDLAQLTDGKCCPALLSNRIVILQVELRGSVRQLGILAEQVGLREVERQPAGLPGEAGEPTALGGLRLDEQGIFQHIEISRLVSEERQAVLFPFEKER
jgi:chemotaxis-related protein WspB